MNPLLKNDLKALVKEYTDQRGEENGTQWGYARGTSFDDFCDWLNGKPTNNNRSY